MYKVLCTVSGGVTGFRQSYLKGYNGKVKLFVTYDEAYLEASGLAIQRNSDPYRKASFAYSVVEHSDVN